ncbi:MAG TPA: amino acid adenylation domain-containing protein, partial [Blastocatellia bacterium]|nr:amino acid adenylation domain-containing protein [Blastocatellia bacterium]
MKIDPEHHVLLLVMHHIVFDGWSIEVLLDEFSRLYQACVSGEQIALQELPIQYADYAIWQREWLQGEVLEQQLKYWSAQIKDGHGLLDLPLDRSRPAVRNYNGNQVTFNVPEPLGHWIKLVRAKEALTLNAILLSAFHALLHRYSGQEDIYVGTGAANRYRGEVERLIGCFVNTLVMRASVTEGTTIKQLLVQTRDTVLGAQVHQDLPFEKLIEVIEPQRNMSHSPIFQVMFSVQGRQMQARQLPGVTMTRFDVEMKVAHFDLILFMADAEAGLTGRIEYNTDIFDEATVKRMAGHYQRVLEGFVSDLEMKISAIPLLSPCERAELLDEWNPTVAEDTGCTVMHRLIARMAEARPDGLAIVHGDESISYGAFNRRANQLSRYLRGKGAGPDKIVGVCLTRTVDMVVGLLAILKAGACYLPLDPSYPRDRLEYMLEDSGSELLLASAGTKEMFAAQRIEKIWLEWDEISAFSDDELDAEVWPGNLAYVIYTSGSTGRPKGVGVQHNSAANLIRWHQARYAIGANDRVTQVARLGFDASVWELWPALAAGTVVHLGDDEVLLSPEKTQQWLEERDITVSFLPTPVAEAVVNLGSRRIGSLRSLLTGGDRLHRGNFSDLEYELVNNYGPTEATVVATSCRVNGGGGEAPSIGRPIDRAQAFIVDRRLEIAPIGVKGEILIGGAGVARGYIGRPEFTAEKFVPNGLNGYPGARLYVTGDIGRYLLDGRIDFAGRVDNQIQVRGYRIELGEIEKVACEYPGIAEAAVLYQEEEQGRGRLIAFIVERGNGIEAALAREFMAQRLPEYMVPSSYVKLAELPRTAAGKVDRRRLAEEDRQEEKECEGDRSRTPTQEMLAEIWCEVLALDKVGVDESFFDLGGHSLLATMVMSRVLESFHVQLPVKRLFETPTVSGLSKDIEEAIREKEGFQAPRINPVPRSSRLPLSFAQQRLWFIDQLA